MRGGRVLVLVGALCAACVVAVPVGDVVSDLEKTWNSIKTHNLRGIVSNMDLEASSPKPKSDSYMNSIYNLRGDKAKTNKQEHVTKKPTKPSSAKSAVTKRLEPMSKAGMGKALIGGAIGGLAGGVITSALAGEGIKIDATHALAGAAGAIASNGLQQDKSRNGGQDTNALDSDAAKGIFLGAALGTGVHLGAQTSSGGTTDAIKGRIAAGVLGALVGNLVGKEKAQFRGDGKLNYRELKAGLGNADELSMADLAEAAEISEDRASRFMLMVGTVDGTSPDSGGMMSVMDMAIYLDEDDSGYIDADELIELFGSKAEASRFVMRADSEIGDGDDPDEASIRSDLKLALPTFHAYMKVHMGGDVESDPTCETPEKCIVDEDTLSMATELGSQILLSRAEAKAFLTRAHEVLRTERGIRPESLEHNQLTVKELFDFLVCPKCMRGEEVPKYMQRSDLFPLLKDEFKARKLMRSILIETVEIAKEQQVELKRQAASDVAATLRAPAPHGHGPPVAVAEDLPDLDDAVLAKIMQQEFENRDT